MDIKENGLIKESLDSHWYYRSKAAVLERMLPTRFNRSIIDVGAGSGFFSRYLANRGLVDHALCIDPHYRIEQTEKVGDAILEFRKEPKKSNSEVGLFLDVLEHVEDDVGLLASYRNLLPSHAQFIVTVPAFPFLWSSHDVFLEHYRRYTIRSLRQVIEKAGMRPVDIFYYYALVFPAAVVSRVLGRKDVEPRSRLIKHDFVTNHILRSLCAMERHWMKSNRIFGLSV